MENTLDEYIKKSKVELNKIYTSKEAEKIINENVVALYMDRVTLTEKNDLTGLEIAEKLHIIHSHFDRVVDEVMNEN